MKYAREFILPIAGLALGKKQYSFQLGRKFFELTGFAESSEGDLEVQLTLDKHENMIEFHFAIRGWMQLVCDRCADEYNQYVEGEQHLILKFGDHLKEESDEIVIIPADLHEFDVSQLLYEYLVVLLPYRKVHPEDENGQSACNPEMLRRIAQHSPETYHDPRWDALRKLSDN